MPRPRPTVCSSLRIRNAHGHVTRAIFVWKFTGNWPDTDDTTSIKHRALSVTVRTHQVGHTVWGKKNVAGEIFHVIR